MTELVHCIMFGARVDFDKSLLQTNVQVFDGGKAVRRYALQISRLSSLSWYGGILMLDRRRDRCGELKVANIFVLLNVVLEVAWRSSMAQLPFDTSPEFFVVVAFRTY